MPLNCFLVARKRLAFDGRIGCCGVAAALASEKDAASGSMFELQRIEKQLNFSPTFADYVKIMESVKSDRSNLSRGGRGGDYDWSSSKRRSKAVGNAGVKLQNVKHNSDGKENGHTDRRESRKAVHPDPAKEFQHEVNYQQKKVGWEEKERRDTLKNTTDNSVWKGRGAKQGIVDMFDRKDEERFESTGKIRWTREDVDVQFEKGSFVRQDSFDRQRSSKPLADSRRIVTSDIGGTRRTMVFQSERRSTIERDAFVRQNSSMPLTGNRRNDTSEMIVHKMPGSSGREILNYKEISRSENGRIVQHDNFVRQRSSDSITGSLRNPISDIRGTRGNMVVQSEMGSVVQHDAFAWQKSSKPVPNRRNVQRTPSRSGIESLNHNEISQDAHSYPYRRKLNSNEKFQRSEQHAVFSERRTVHSRAKENELKVFTPALSRMRYDRIKKDGDLELESDQNDLDTRGTVHHEKRKAIQASRQTYLRSDKLVPRHTVETDWDDRAAFKTFEVFTDAKNMPRVPRMEMEERIQKLARRLNATAVEMPEWHFSKMMHGAKIRFSDHSILRVVQILGQFENWRRVLQVVEWLHTRERFKSLKSRYIYTSVLDVLGKARKPVEALNVFYSMLEQLSSYPDLAAYHCIAVTLGQAGLMKELFGVIDCMRSPPKKKFKLGVLQKWDPRLEPDLIVYNAVLNACVQQKQWEGAFWVLQQLQQQGIRPTSTTYGLVMEVMLACGKYNLVYEFFRKMQKSCMPAALNYKVLINALWRESKVDEAVLAVKDLERRGIVGSASLYYDFARCLCSAGRCQEALLQIPKICAVAKKPLVVTYTGLIQTCEDAGNIENAKYIFGQMQKFCSPNCVTCNIMLKSYIEHGKLDDANHLFHDIIEGRMFGKVDNSEKVVPDKYTFKTMMGACTEAGNWDEFEYAFCQMLYHGHHFDARRDLRMVLDAFRAGKSKVLETTWDHLLKYDRIPPAPLIMERFCFKLREADTMEAISCISSFQDRIHKIPMGSWLNLLRRNGNNLKEHVVAKFVAEISNLAEASSSDSVYQGVFSTCKRFLSEVTTVPEQG